MEYRTKLEVKITTSSFSDTNLITSVLVLKVVDSFQQCHDVTARCYWASIVRCRYRPTLTQYVRTREQPFKKSVRLSINVKCLVFTYVYTLLNFTP
jgi:hypothetical protein